MAGLAVVSTGLAAALLPDGLLQAVGLIGTVVAIVTVQVHLFERFAPFDDESHDEWMDRQW